MDSETTQPNDVAASTTIEYHPPPQADPNRSESITEIAKALCNMQKTNLEATADSVNPYFNNAKYADLSSVWAVIRKPLTDAGLSIMQTVGTSDEDVNVTTTLFHTSGEFIRSSLSAEIPLSKKEKKKTIQGLGSAITYLRRYALSAMIGVCPVDDDAELAMDRTGSTKTESVPQRKTHESTPAIPGMPEGKKLILLEFPTELRDCNIGDFEITVKQCNEEGTHFSVKDINVFTDTNGQYWSAAKGFSATHARVHVDILDAILKFGIDKVKELHPKVDFVPYKSAGGK